MEDTTPSADRPRSYEGALMENGKRAERIVLDWLRSHPGIIGVDDLRELRVMREADVDCSFRLTNGQVTLAEIKSDKWIGRSGRYLFEALRINHTARPEHAMTLGWSARSPARWLLYYSPHLHQIHQIAFDDFRDAMQKYTRSARKKTRLDFVETDNIKSTVNILIPEKYVTSKATFKPHEV